MRFLTPVLATICFLEFSWVVRADQLVWTGPQSGGLFNDPASWTSLSGATGVFPGSGDFVSFDNLRVSYSPAVVVVPTGFSFGVQNLFVSGLSTFMQLNGTSNSVAGPVLVQAGVSGGDNPVSLVLSGSGGVQAGGNGLIGTDGGVTSTLLVTNHASFGANTIQIGGNSTNGVLSGNMGATLNASAVQAGFNSVGALMLDSGTTLNVNGFGGGLTLGAFGGTGVANVNINSNVNLTNGPLTVGGQSGTGSLNVEGANFFLFGSPSTVNANDQPIIIGSPTGTGTVTVGMLGVLETTGPLTIGSGGSSNGKLMVSGVAPTSFSLNGTVSSGALVVGANGGTGALGVQSFGTVTASSLMLGESGGNGTLVATGAGSQITVNGDVEIGQGNGSVGFVGINADSTGTANLSTTGAIGIGSVAGAQGALSVTGSVNSNGFVVGDGGMGGIQITGNGSVTASGISFIGALGGNGTLILKDHGLFFSVDTSADSLVLGTLSGNGSMQLSGNSTVFVLGTLTAGTASGTGAVQILDSALVAAPNIRVGDGGTGIITISGGGLVGGSPNLNASTQLVLGANGGHGTLTANDASRIIAGDILVAVDKGSTGALSLQSDTVLNASGKLTVGSTISGGGTASVSVDHATLSVGSAAIGQGGDLGLLVVNDRGKFSSVGNLTIGSNGQMVSSDAGTLVSVAGTLTVSGPVAAVPVKNSNLLLVSNGAEVDAGSINIGTGGGTGTVEVSGAGSLLKSAGTTDIGSAGGAGILFLTMGGKLVSAGNVTVHSGGLLHGAGAVTGNVVNAGGTVQPGSSPGTLTLNGDYTQTDGTLKFEIFGPNPGDVDHLAITGNADFLGGFIDLSFFYTPICCTTFDLISIAGSGDFSGLKGIEVTGLSQFSFVTNFTDGVFSVTETAEPSTWALLGFGLIAIFGARRSRRPGVNSYL